MGSDGKGGFCAWASDIYGFHLTLPTEAQWEYAARGNEGGLEFSWGNLFDDSKLWCSKDTKREQTAPVVRTSNIYGNAFGLTDMAGNVWQWCSDLYAPYSSSSQTDPVGPSSTSDNWRCVRGGSWNSLNPDYFRCVNRGWFSPVRRYDDIGFRLCRGTALRIVPKAASGG
jgi:formylglycine-generating enzyme required for sulfatase activity